MSAPFCSVMLFCVERISRVSPERFSSSSSRQAQDVPTAIVYHAHEECVPTVGPVGRLSAGGEETVVDPVGLDRRRQELRGHFDYQLPSTSNQRLLVRNSFGVILTVSSCFHLICLHFSFSTFLFASRRFCSLVPLP